MNKTSRSSGLLARLWSRPTPDPTDAADLGTAFGLELSLAPFADGPPTARAWQPPIWVQWLTSRGRGGI